MAKKSRHRLSCRSRPVKRISTAGRSVFRAAWRQYHGVLQAVQRENSEGWGQYQFPSLSQYIRIEVSPLSSKHRPPPTLQKAAGIIQVAFPHKDKVGRVTQAQSLKSLKFWWTSMRKH